MRNNNPYYYRPAYIRSLKLQGRKPSTLWSIEKTLDYLEKHKVNITDREVVECYLLHKLEAGVSTSRVRGLLIVIKTFNRFLLKEGLSIDTKVLDIPYPTRRYKEKRILSDEQIEAFISIPVQVHYRTSKNGVKYEVPNDPKGHEMWSMFWKICAFSGMRMGEVSHLKKGGIDFARRVIVIADTKTNTPRMVPISLRIDNDLKTYCSALGGDYLFASRRGGNKMGLGKVFDSTDWLTDFNRRLKILGIEKIPGLTPYSLRHSAATRWLDEDMNLFRAQQILGHKRVTTTAIYTHLSTKQMVKALDTKDRMTVKDNPPERKIEMLRQYAEDIGCFTDPALEMTLNSTLFAAKIKDSH